MKLLILFSLASFILLTSACGQSYNDNENYNANYSNQDYGNTYGNQEVNNNVRPDYGNNGRRVKYPMKDLKTGMVISYFPVPKDWKQDSKGYLVGPDGIITFEYPARTFSMQQRQINSVEQVLKEDIIPSIQKNGGKYKNSFHIPEVANADKHIYSKYWKVMPVQCSHEAMGVEFLEDNGNPSLLVVHFTYTQSQYGSFSSYSANQLRANHGSYEQAKKDFIYALANMQLDPQYLAAYNRREQQKSQASWNAHNQRMRNNQANFESHNRKMQDTYNDINNITMQNYYQSSSSSDRMQEQFVDGIWEQQNMYDPNTGTQMKVDQGYDNYYYNEYNNQYIGTDDNLYNPQMDPNINNTEWNQLEPSNDDW
ncbi:MAG: hypothetical protein AAGI07_07510 [Bacteroidota bacterium]